MKVIGAVHDSILIEYEKSDCIAPRYHWVEDGDYDAIKDCILKSDWASEQSLRIEFGFASTHSHSFALMGTVTGRVAGRDANLVEIDRVVAVDAVPLMGTFTALPHVYEQGDVVVTPQGQHWVAVNFSLNENPLMDMLLARPEMNEPKTAAA